MTFPAVVTLWYINAADPAAVLASEPRADRGFGRKLLAHMNPRWPITPIGQFPLNRSSTASRDEFYIASYPGVAVLQTYVEECGLLSDIPELLRKAVPAADVYIFAEGVGRDSDSPHAEASTYAGIAHFSGDTVHRSLCATRTQLLEDIGLPEPFEAPYWAGEKADQIGGISLPFEPKDLLHAAQADWLGVDVSPSGQNINVVGYAVDGRPEPKVEQPRKERTKNVNEVAAKFAEGNADYDDYSDVEPETEGDEFAELADASAAAARRVGRGLRRRVRNIRDTIVERIRHSDR